MIHFSSAECQRQWGKVQDTAMTQPVTITNNGRDRLVLLSVQEYARLKRRDREVLSIDNLTEEEVAAIAAAEPPADTAQFDHELKNPRPNETRNQEGAGSALRGAPLKQGGGGVD